MEDLYQEIMALPEVSKIETEIAEKEELLQHRLQI